MLNKKSDVKWCPASSCQYAVEVDDVVDASQEVVCNCSYKFCWNCLQESHRPIDCDTVKKWVSMINDDESQSLSWIHGNSKPCPKCKRDPFGCMRMRCLPPCEFQFCWICLRDWNVHGYDDAAPCNQYRPPEEREDENESKSQSLSDDVMKMNAKMSSDRFLFYLERWKENEKSQEKALSDLQRVREVELKKMSDSPVISTSQSWHKRIQMCGRCMATDS
jgi:ariadne-1